MRRSRWVGMVAVLLAMQVALDGLADEPTLKLAIFNVDVTPPPGTPLCDALVQPVEAIDDPLSARGIALLGAEEPIVLCAVDWVGIGNTGHDQWREALAKAAGTKRDRVALHCLHQHDAPGLDFLAEELAAAEGLGGKLYNIPFSRQAIAKVAEAVRASLKNAQPVTHVAVGQGRVSEVASNRRILLPNGKVGASRSSSCRDEKLRAEPEGVIDPLLRLVALWNGDKPLVALTYYATHPQSYYGRGRVSADFPGLARALREKAEPSFAHIHFNGAGGNVAAGKYNDGSEPLRAILAERVAKGMELAWNDAKSHKAPLTAKDVHWKTALVALPARETLEEAKLLAQIRDAQIAERLRLQYVRDLAFLKRCQAGHQTTLAALELGSSVLLHLPGELFVEYQLAAQAMRKDSSVCVAAYGDYGAGYIGTSVAYDQGGYETSRVSRVSGKTEATLLAAIESLLRTSVSK